MQLAGYLNENLEEYNKKYWEELLNNSDECNHYIFYDNLNVNNISNADMQSNDGKLEDITLDLHDWAL